MNVIGMRTLLEKEIRRFMRVPGQTVLSPLITTTLYFIVFGYGLSARLRQVDGVPYLEFIVPGLIFLGLANNAFLNTSSSLFITKMQNTLVDLLVAPLGPFELLFGFIGGGMVRGLCVGLFTWLVAVFFTGLHCEHPLTTAFFLLLSAYVFSMIGLLVAVWAEKFEHINAYPTFIMLPLTFLGGVFYSIRELPNPWRTVSLFNPMAYMVDGLRYSMIGSSQMPPYIGVLILSTLAIASTLAVNIILRTGYRLKH